MILQYPQNGIAQIQKGHSLAAVNQWNVIALALYIFTMQ